MNSNAITPTAVIRCDKVQWGKHYYISRMKKEKKKETLLHKSSQTSLLHSHGIRVHSGNTHHRLLHSIASHCHRSSTVTPDTTTAIHTSSISHPHSHSGRTAVSHSDSRPGSHSHSHGGIGLLHVRLSHERCGVDVVVGAGGETRALRGLRGGGQLVHGGGGGGGRGLGRGGHQIVYVDVHSR